MATINPKFSRFEQVNQILYTEVTIQPLSNHETELLSAFLLNNDYESVWEEENTLKAYISSDKFNLEFVQETILQLGFDSQTAITFVEMENINWNKEWETHFEPVVLHDLISIRAPFHPKPKNIRYDVLIQPQMSFGTGHHATTASVMKLMMELNLEHTKVLDYGCGTGILAIFAKMLGADVITAIDYDPICIENTEQNIQLNNVGYITTMLGNIDIVQEYDYQIILANITKNTLIDNMFEIGRHVLYGGYLICSGFYTEDVSAIKQSAEKQGFTFIKSQSENNWCALLFTKTI